MSDGVLHQVRRRAAVERVRNVRVAQPVRTDRRVRVSYVADSISVWEKSFPLWSNGRPLLLASA